MIQAVIKGFGQSTLSTDKRTEANSNDAFRNLFTQYSKMHTDLNKIVDK